MFLWSENSKIIHEVGFSPNEGYPVHSLRSHTFLTPRKIFLSFCQFLGFKVNILVKVVQIHLNGALFT